MTESCTMDGPRCMTHVVLLVLLVLVSLSSMPTSHAGNQLPVARIVRVESDSHVMPGESFTVLVTVDYSERYSTDIGIMDVRTGFVLSSKGLIIPAGTNLFTFFLIGRDDPGVWSLVVHVRVWYQGGWYADQNGSTFPFQITVSDPLVATLTLRSNLASATIKIDGVAFSSSASLELSTKRGFHMIEVEPLVMLGQGTRAVFDHWNDGVQSSSRQIYVPERLEISAIYLTEFYLNVESSAGETVGSGWYPAGKNATFAALDPVQQDRPSSGIQRTYKFSHWSGDCESISPTAWVEMDRPKTAVANWSEDTSEAPLSYQPAITSIAFLSSSAMLIAVGIALRRRKRARPYDASSTRNGILSGLLLALILSAVLVHFPAIQPANALTLLQPESIMIGDANWYHWNATASDTLLIWLGGGIVRQSSFMVNPLEFESYNTVRFVQDLAQYYDVLALEKGSMRVFDATLNKTVYGEPYPGSSDFVEEIRLWALGQGYTYLYLVGYSVGAMVAVRELGLAKPTEWTSPSGLIIITTKIPSSAAGPLRASLLMLYGDKIAPEFTASGEQFFLGAPEDGWKDGYYFHKEYDVIPDVEHEVWTIYESGEYNGHAAVLTVKFIEATKSLQFERLNENLLNIALYGAEADQADSSSIVRITSVNSPPKVRTGQVFKVTATARYELASDSKVAVVAFDPNTGSVLSAAEKHLTGTGQAEFVTTLVSGNSSRTWSFTLIPLVYSHDGVPAVAGVPSGVMVDVTNSFALTVVMPYPNLPVQIDDQALDAGANGEVATNLDSGGHSISVPSVIMLESNSRLVFEGWNDTSSSANLQLTLSRDLTLIAIYRRQYYLSVSSPFGEVAGVGWYDGNSTAIFQVAPPLVTGETTHVFMGWSGEHVDSSPSSSVSMNSPKDIRAVWKDLRKDLKPSEANPPADEAWWVFIFSSLVLVTSLVFAAISARPKRGSLVTGVSR